ncbi:DUF3817 domain-containing protein [Kitasatospora sp. P5_F3]
MKQSVLTRYRVLAYVTGVLLVMLTLGVIGKYALDLSGAADFTKVVGMAHGWLYVVYLVFAFDLGTKAKCLPTREGRLSVFGPPSTDTRTSE